MLPAQAIVLLSKRLLRFGQRSQLLLQRGARFGVEQRQGAGAAAQVIQRQPRRLVTLVDGDGDLAIDLGAGQLLQQFGALAGLRVKKRGELPLRQHHRAGKALEVEARQRLDQF